MKIKIISKYEETKAMLRDKVRKGIISVFEKEKGDFQCYFCESPIKGRIRILIDEELEGKCKSYSKYPVGEGCYNQAKLYMYFSGIPFSLN
ncbi:MAG: hypothetical protein QF567_01465 [Candidatus Pacearchaeota archaeon]|jgi:hypothetical protein|nr:hypothetical protein [Candidatus Pacearchaeota archaeon]MDP7520883.1 hypothetical protein [Candidatus Pacearchaeota archaeon]|tara:strand:+ start:96 stop:368 length:273 start_codon:yes stop_codon:yes gene_type:complete